MARLIGPDMGSRAVFLPSGAPAAGRTGVVYADAAGTVLADVRVYDGTATPGAAYAGSLVTVDAYGLLPLLWFPDGLDRVWITVNGGPLVPIDADYNARLDAVTQTANAAVAQLPASNGTDDTATINTALAASAGKRVRGLPGQTYLISAPLVVYSGTEVDMTGCTITLLPGSNCNMLNNRAVATVRRVLDAVTTSGTPTLSSATAALTAADVGKPITIQGAGTGGVPLTTTISAVTNGTTATLAANAGTSVTGQYAAIGARDSNITVIGGLWDRTTNGPVGAWDAHALRLRHVDGLDVRGVAVASTGGGGSKYGINPGDCSRVRVLDCTVDVYGSDFVHFNGPCSQVLVRGIMARSLHDDLVSFTARDSTAIITDCAGDITDVVVDGASYTTATFTSSALKVIAGRTTDGSADYAVRRLAARDLTGPTTTAPVVFVGDTAGGVFDDIDLDGVTSLGGSNSAIVLLRGGTIGAAKIRRVVAATGDKVSVAVDATAARLDVADIDAHARLTGVIGVQVTPTGNVDSLIVDNVRGKGTVANQQLIRVDAGGRIGSMQATHLDFEASAPADGSRLVDCPSGATISTVQLDVVRTLGVDYPLGVYAGTTTLIPDSVTATGMNSWLWARSGSALTLLATNSMVGDQDKLKEDVLGSTLVIRRNSLTMDPDLLAAGEETIPRLHVQGGQTAATGQLLLTYFTARKTETIGNTRTFTESVAAAGATLARIGIYSVATNGDLTLVAATANDTTLWNGTFGNYTRALTASWAKQAGRRYAVGVLMVGTTGPKLRAIAPVNGSEAGQSPRINGSVAGQTDLPASITAATVTNSQGISVYAALVP